MSNPKMGSRVKRATPEMMVAYLSYAVEDVRALSASSASLLEGAIAALMQDAGVGSERVKHDTVTTAAAASRNGSVGAAAKPSSHAR